MKAVVSVVAEFVEELPVCFFQQLFFRMSADLRSTLGLRTAKDKL